ncbi:WS/DGAT/MGAT family O-acyltransferase [Leekyejoonella antrihumi]|uniref:Diacylglycerol O-acyltransferase n=1 Tax=Leekyejoonella antrihumi TaxID=1660198 RepID=A0A563E4E4_9MICO|nr:wax ester/triacylglycerol synthase family O-acyltransferase [Leekyejoonella antrihumi]TWP37400.1 wax ester/triacylglycerol synthase family O-acyltransferase [Leekyejoonella antrihumi]
MPAMGPIDSGFLMVETREHPMHVGGLQLFTPPDGDGGQFARDLVQTMHDSPVGKRWRMRPATPVSSLGNFRWQVDDQVDLDYHVRRSAVPSPGRLRELFELTSRWQSGLLDRHRPLWEVHVVEGLEDGRVAVFTKVHHALVDGVSALRLMQRACSPDPDARDCLPPFGLPDSSSAAVQSSGLPIPSLGDVMRGGGGLAKELVTLAPNALKVASRALRDTGYTTPFEAPRTVLNGRVGGARRFVAQSFAMNRFRTIGKGAGMSFNDVVLAVCGGALRAYLEEMGELPDTSLTSMVPVNLRNDVNDVGGNNIGAIIVSLGTDVADAALRLQVVHESALAAKTTMRELGSRQIMLLSALNVSGLGLAGIPGFLSVGHPPFNVVISNVPGPKKQMYFNGGHLEGTYPASIACDGMAINISLVTYDDQVDFGITACRSSAPSVQRLIHHLEDALADLEAVYA